MTQTTGLARVNYIYHTRFLKPFKTGKILQSVKGVNF